MSNHHQNYGDLNPLLERSHKTSYQETLEACLTAVAVAFANKHYDSEFTEDDIVLRAMNMAETIIAATGHRFLWLATRSENEKTYDPRTFFGNAIANRNDPNANYEIARVEGGDAIAGDTNDFEGDPYIVLNF